ncbi:hypothetical protein DSCA_21690 [Desulfosarcina alkanivorans]|uniref:Glycosyltransferase RgtA/B/C/D-like domain-containing protein n=1 Tax=Desulfosarcina alkanivorans TaxID=571177 RepID=A0A5K7YK49_9BACT|nr:hypothetical protein [Desulfosarcina alkanivorans]BBO68239.1 hypothetical protein DSCA_21690 [Desulfosarcina alkanivorans]
MAWVALGLSAETAVFILAGFAWLLSREYTLAEAGAGAVVLVFIALSLVHQLSLLSGSLLPGFVLESTALATVFFLGFRRLPDLPRWWAAMSNLVRQEAFSAGTIAGAWSVMAGLLVVGWWSLDPPPPAFPWHGLRFGTIPGAFWRFAGADAIEPLNAQALFFHTARFGLGADACGFGLLAYMAVGLSTYALARRYAWPPMALTVTLMVLSMPRLVALGRWPSAEMVSTAAVVFSMLLVYRLVEQHRSGDLRLFVLCTFFSLSASPLSVALVPVMFLLMTVVVVRRHGWLMLRELAAAKPFSSFLVLLPALVLAQIPVVLVNLANAHPLWGGAILFESGGLTGAAANLLRFFFASVDPTGPVQQMLVWLVGLDLNRLLAVGYTTLAAVFGHPGANTPFVPFFSGSGSMGFGPFAPLLVLPAMFHAMVRGPRRLKAVGVAWAGYLYLAALVVAWHAGSPEALTPLYAANGFAVAFSLPPWRLRRRGMRIFQVAFALLLAWSLTCGRCM